MPYKLTMFLDAAGGVGEKADRRRLHNLGYASNLPLEKCVTFFQLDYGIEPVTGRLDDGVTREKLRLAHDGGFSREEIA